MSFRELVNEIQRGDLQSAKIMWLTNRLRRNQSSAGTNHSTSLRSWRGEC